MSALILAPDGYDAVKEQAAAAHVLRYLLTCYPNQLIQGADVVQALGYPVSRAAVSNAAIRLRRGPFGLNIRSRASHGGGYVLLVPVPASGDDRCGSCCERSVVGTCKALKGRPVEDSEWCWGW